MMITVIKTPQVLITDAAQMADHIIGQLAVILIVHKTARIIRTICIVVQITM